MRYYLRITKVQKSGRRTGERKVVATTRSGDYTIEQLDCDYYVVTGPHLSERGVRVSGWADGLRLIDGGL